MATADLQIHTMAAPRVVPRDGITVREDTLYANAAGVEDKGIRKRAEQALERLREVLPKLLEPGEAVLYIARAQAPAGTLEKLTFGWYIHYIGATALVVTNRRLFHVRIKMKSFGRWEYGRGLRAVHWGDVADARVKGWLSHTLELKYASGKKEVYWGLRRVDAKVLKVVLAAVLPASTGERSPAQGMVALCPGCHGALADGAEHCAQCQLLFKTNREMVRRSLLFPGGGYFYAGYWWLGIGDALVESILLGVLVGSGLIAAGLPEANLGVLERSTGPSEALFLAGFLAVVLILEKLLTIHHGRRFLRDILPDDRKAGGAGWVVLGVLSYALAVLFILVQVSFEPPMARVASDLAVREAHFGLFESLQDGGWSFTPATSVPRLPGQHYGWVLRVHTRRENVSFREEYHLSNLSESDLAAGYEPLVVNEDATAPDGGLIVSLWQMQEDEPAGERSFDVYLENTLVGTFKFVAP